MRIASARAPLALCAALWLVARPAAGLELDEAWAVARQRLPALRATAARTDALRARVDQAAVPLLPTASLDVIQAVTTANFVQRPGAVPRSFTTGSSATTVTTSPELYPFFQVAGNVRWTVWDFGQTAAALDAARSTARAAALEEDTLRQRLWVQVATAYLQALAAQAVAEVAEDAAQLAQRRRDLVQARVRAEVRPMLDLLRAEADVQSADVARMRAHDDIHNARLALGLSMGLDRAAEGTLRPPQAPTATVSEGQLEGSAALDAWVAEAGKARPELRAAEAELEAARAQLRATALQWMPSVFVAGQMAVAGTEFERLVYNFSATAGASLPISGVWLQVPQAAELRANLRQIQAGRDAAALQIRGEIDAARQVWLQVRRRRAPVHTLFALADKAHEHARARYLAGATSLVEVIDTEAARNQARLQVAQIELDEALAIARWQVAMGRVGQ
ncbi:MAG: TolC family protein [Deltaproteobacteria bacterium]|nr:TolC family protein [Deltaproteobacteria bacterium]